MEFDQRLFKVSEGEELVYWNHFQENCNYIDSETIQF